MLCAVFNAEAQDTPVTWGAKAGANLTSYGDTITESTLNLPVIFRYRILRSFFLKARPQLGYILDRKEEVEENPFGPGSREMSLFPSHSIGFKKFWHNC